MINPINAVVSTEVEVIYSEDRDKDQPLYDYLDLFVEEAAEHGIDLSYVYDGKIEIYFGTWQPTILSGLSTGYKNDNLIKIYINEAAWDYRNEIDKKFLIFHELGHDIFDLKHGDTELLNPGTLSLDESRADEIFEEFWNHVK